MQAVGLQFSNNLNYGCPYFLGVSLKITGASPLQFSMELQEIACIHKLIIMKKIAGASPLQFSGELLETGVIHNSGYWKIAGLRPAIFSGTLGTGSIHNLGFGKIKTRSVLSLLICGILFSVMDNISAI